MSDYATLGLSEHANEDQVKKAYRKLAMKHHPDRGGQEAAFKSIQTAYDRIAANGFRPVRQAPPHQRPQGAPHQKPKWEPPRSPGNTWRDKEDINNIFEEMKEANRNASRTGSWNSQDVSGEKVGMVSLREAFAGYNMIVPKKHQRGALIQNDTVNIPPGMPNGYRGTFATSSGGRETIITRIDTGNYRLRSLQDQDNLFSAGLYPGDIELDVELDAIDLIAGTWIKTQDFLGEKLDVRVPEGFNPLHRLKIAGKGYYGWLQEYNRPSNNRQDMYIKITPIWRKPADIDPMKIIRLYQTIQDLE